MTTRGLLLALTALAQACGHAAPTVAGSSPLARFRPPHAATLVVLDERDHACLLRALDLEAGRWRELAHLPAPCLGGRLGFRADRARVVVWFDPATRHEALIAGPTIPAPGHADDADLDGTARLYEVDLVAGTARELPPPVLDDPVAELGYARDGTIVALTSHEGARTVARAYRLGPSGWAPAAEVPTTTGKDGDPAFRALPVAGELGPTSRAALDHHLDAPGADPGLRAAAAALAPSVDAFAWLTVPTAAGPLELLALEGEAIAATGRITWRDAAGVPAALPGLGLTAGDLVALRLRGRFLLVAGPTTGAYPRVYDLRRRTRVYASDTARAAMFWPDPPAAAVGPCSWSTIDHAGCSSHAR